VREGLLVRDVAAGSRAGEAGIRAGDVIVEVNRQPVHTAEELKTHIDEQVKGAPMVLRVRRDGGTMYVAIPAV
jgi:serine protease Do